MAVKQIKIKESVYDELNEMKASDESFSLVLQRLIDENKHAQEFDIEKKAYENMLYNMDLLPNYLTLEGVNVLLNKSMLNEVPKLLNWFAFSIVEFSILANVDNYPEDKFDLYVEKSSILLQRMCEFVESEHFSQTNENFKMSFGFYIGYLSKKINQEDKYKDIVEKLI